MKRLNPSERISRVVTHFEMTYNAFAISVGRSKPQYLHDIVKGKTKQITATVAQEIVSRYPTINYDWLITGIGEMLNSENDIISNKSNMPLVVTVDSSDNENIPFVPVKARAGYLDGYYNIDFMKSLPTYRVPGLNNGTFRMFEVAGNSMDLTLPNKSIAIGEWVENWRENIKDGRVYIIVYDDKEKMEDGIIIKRCLNRIAKYNNLICKSDTLDRASYPNRNIDPGCIKEVWELKGAFKFDFPDPINLFDRVNDVESEIEELKRMITNKL